MSPATAASPDAATTGLGPRWVQGVPFSRIRAPPRWRWRRCCADLGRAMKSFTFVSTANAVALRGATPVFVDIRPDTLNIDERLIEAAITKRTKAICVVHYAGVAC